MIGDLATELRALLSKITEGMGTLKRIGPELAPAQKALRRVELKVSHIPPADQAMIRAAWNPLDARIRSLTADAALWQSRADTILSQIKAALKKLVGLGQVQSIVLLLKSVAWVAAGVAWLWKVVKNDSGRLKLESEKLDALVNGKLTPEQIKALNAEADRGSGGLKFGLGLGLAAALALGAFLLMRPRATRPQA